MLSIRFRRLHHPRIGYLAQWPVLVLVVTSLAGGSVARIGCLVPDKGALIAP